MCQKPALVSSVYVKYFMQLLLPVWHYWLTNAIVYRADIGLGTPQNTVKKLSCEVK